MRKIPKTFLALSISALLSSCSSNNGSFESNNVEVPKVTEQISPPKMLQDVVTETRQEEKLTVLTEPSLGVSMPFVRRDVFPKSVEESVMLDGNSLKFSSSKENIDNIVLIHQEELRNMDKSSTNLEKHQNSFEHENKWYGSRNRDYMKYVKAGWVADLQPSILFKNGKAYRGMTGFLFYQGKDPSKSLPASKTVTYKGTWDFMTNAVKGRALDSDPRGSKYDYILNPGDAYSAFSYHESLYDDSTWREQKKVGEVSHSSEFTVDFDKKSLTGSLYRNKSKDKKDQIKRYDITAKLHGNRFRGSATAFKSDDKFFGANSTTLEGGFFGPNAEELGGKFLADNHSLFAVFGARQDNTSDSPSDKTEKRFDAWKFNLEEKTWKAQEMDTFGNATQLVIDGRSFSLLPEQDKNRREHQLTEQNKKLVINACCSNLNYAKFGNYFKEDNTDSKSKSDTYLFFTGERTPVSQLKKEGSYKYHGTWAADVLTVEKHQGSVTASLNKSSDSRAEFDVNFGEKTVKGALYQQNSIKPTISITDGRITDNGFTAKFASEEKGFVLDSVSSRTATFNGKVDGAFYGPNASEMGGYFNSEDTDKDQIMGVFGAKQQELR